MQRKKILVPLGMTGTDLKSVHYALALAERIEAQVYILQSGDGDAVGADQSMTLYMGEALLDLINSARQAGLKVSHHVTHKTLKEEIVGLVRDEHIDLLVFGEEEEKLNNRLLLQVKPLVSSQIIQVRGKKHIH
jgi:nucleotide-binding universal stress UspA family protein